MTDRFIAGRPSTSRIGAVERFADCTEHVLTVGDLQWADVAKDSGCWPSTVPFVASRKAFEPPFCSVDTTWVIWAWHLCARLSRTRRISVSSRRSTWRSPRSCSCRWATSAPCEHCLRIELYRGQGDGTALVSRYFLEWAVAKSEETRAVLTVLKEAVRVVGWHRTDGGVCRRPCRPTRAV